MNAIGKANTSHFSHFCRLLEIYFIVWLFIFKGYTIFIDRSAIMKSVFVTGFKILKRINIQYYNFKYDTDRIEIL